MISLHIESLPSQTRLVKLDQALAIGILLAIFQHASVASLLRFRTAAADLLPGLDPDLWAALLDDRRGGWDGRRVSHDDIIFSSAVEEADSADSSPPFGASRSHRKVTDRRWQWKK